MQSIASELIKISEKAGRVSHCKAEYFKSLFSWRNFEVILECSLLSRCVILHVTCLGGFTFVCLKKNKNRNTAFFFPSAFSFDSFKIHFALYVTLHLFLLKFPNPILGTVEVSVVVMQEQDKWQGKNKADCTVRLQNYLCLGRDIQMIALQNNCSFYSASEVGFDAYSDCHHRAFDF